MAHEGAVPNARYERTLRRLPTAALAARNRELVNRRIRQSFHEAMVAAEPPPARQSR